MASYPDFLLSDVSAAVHSVSHIMPCLSYFQNTDHLVLLVVLVEYYYYHYYYYYCYYC